MSFQLAPISVDTHAERVHVIRAYPRWLRYACEGNPHHAMWVWETHVAFAALAWTPWRWLT
jgi:hypothetical protein